MTQLAGTWDCLSSTPMGEQKSVMALKLEGNSVTGTVTTDLETIEISDGQFDGKTFTWRMRLTEPFKMNMTGEAVLDGDQLVGTVGAFMGKSALRGARRAS